MKFRHLIRFAAQDLSAWRWAALGVSLTILATIAIVTAITVTIMGWLGARKGRLVAD